jgi:hypothetical protein
VASLPASGEERCSLQGVSTTEEPCHEGGSTAADPPQQRQCNAMSNRQYRTLRQHHPATVLVLGLSRWGSGPPLLPSSPHRAQHGSEGNAILHMADAARSSQPHHSYPLFRCATRVLPVAPCAPDQQQQFSGGPSTHRAPCLAHHTATHAPLACRHHSHTPPLPACCRKTCWPLWSRPSGAAGRASSPAPSCCAASQGCWWTSTGTASQWSPPCLRCWGCACGLPQTLRSARSCRRSPRAASRVCCIAAVLPMPLPIHCGRAHAPAAPLRACHAPLACCALPSTHTWRHSCPLWGDVPKPQPPFIGLPGGQLPIPAVNH